MRVGVPREIKNHEYRVGLTPPSVAELTAAGLDMLYDDRDQPAGSKFATADLVGIPYQIILGPRGLKSGEVEIKRRKSGERETLPLSAAVERLRSLIEPQRMTDI